jgi:hypothetical protein
MKVHFDVPDKVWAHLVELAEERHVSVAVVVSAAVADALRPSSMARLEADARKNHVLQLVRSGMTDAQIAERTGELKSYVGDTRRGAGLAANRQMRSNTEGKAA